MRVPVFVSKPSPHLVAQVEFVEQFKTTLQARGFEPLTLGPGSSYDYEAPLAGIRRLLTHCCGLVSIAFRRTHAVATTKYRGADIDGVTEQLNGDLWFTSPYCQIEPAMAFQLGLPILVLREEGVSAEGVLENGVTGLYLPEFSLSADQSFLQSDAFHRLFEQWGARVQMVYKRRGEPPKLYD